MAELDEEVVDVINANVAALTKGTNLFYGPIRPPGNGIPNKCVFAFINGGNPPESYCDGGAGVSLKQPNVQVMIRSDKGSSDDYGGGSELANDVWEAIHDQSTATGLTYGIKCQQSGPNYLGKDPQDQHIWSINAIVFKEE